MDEIVNSTVDAAVYRSDGIRVYGLDAELEKKAQSKRDQQFEIQAGKWIEEMIKEKMEFPDDVIESLRSGVALCKLVNVIQPGSIKRINTKNIALMQVENITMYLKACWKVGVPSADLFVTSDLFQRKGINQVFQNILSLSRVAAAIPGYNGPKFGAKLAAPPPVKKWDTIQTNQVVYVQDLEKKKNLQQSSNELKQLKATIEAVKAEKEELWNLKVSLEDKISQQEADLELHTHKIQQFETHAQKLEERLADMENACKDLEETITHQAKQIILQESQNQKLRLEKDKFSDEVQRVFQEKLKVFQESVLLQETNDKMEEEKQALIKENQIMMEIKEKAIKEEERIQGELTRAKLAHIEELSSMQGLLQELRQQIAEQRDVVQEEKLVQLKQTQEKEDLRNQLARVSDELVQKAVELSEMKQEFAISKQEYESRLLANKVVSSKELEDKLAEQESSLAKQKVLNRLLQSNIEKMSAEKDAIAKILDAVKTGRTQLEKENLELLIEKEKQREEKLEIVLGNQKLLLELQSAKATLKEMADGQQKNTDERLTEANARIAELRAQLREAEDARRLVVAEQIATAERAQGLALEHVMLQEQVTELEGKDLLAKRDLEVSAAENQTLRDKNAQLTTTIESMTKENEQLVKELISFKHQFRNLKNKSQLEKTKYNEDIAVWKQKHEEEVVKRKSLKVNLQQREKKPSERPMLGAGSQLEKLDNGGDKVRNMSFRKSMKYQEFTQNTTKKLLTSRTPPEAKDIKRLTNLLTSDAGRRRFTINLQSSFKENPQSVIDNMSFDTMMQLFNTMLAEMDLSNSKDFITAKVLMQTANRMTRKMSGDKIQHMQEMIKKHEVWKNPKFWEEYFWEELGKRHRKKHGAEVDHVDTELVYNLLGGFAYNMISWGVSLEDGQKFAQELGQRNGLTAAQIEKISGDLAKLVKSAPSSSTPLSPRGRTPATNTAQTLRASAGDSANASTSSQNLRASAGDNASTSSQNLRASAGDSASTGSSQNLRASAGDNASVASPTLRASGESASASANTVDRGRTESRGSAEDWGIAGDRGSAGESSSSGAWPAQQPGVRSNVRSRNGSVIGTRRSAKLDPQDVADALRPTLQERDGKKREK